MLDQSRIAEAEKNIKRYLEDGWLFMKHGAISHYIHFFLKNAETFLLTAETLFSLSTDPAKKRAIGLHDDFESYLWVVVSSYYAMYYCALALLAKQNIKVGDKMVHKVVSDTLIAQFLKTKKLAGLIEDYEDIKQSAMEIIGAEEKAFELVSSFEYERIKRNALQYELGQEAKHNLANTSLSRAAKFVAEIRQILR